MRHTRIQQAKPERSFAERIVAVIVAIAMLGGMGYATASAAMADDYRTRPRSSRPASAWDCMITIVMPSIRVMR